MGGSTCSDTCGSERELVNNDNIQERILEYSDEGKMKKIHCLNTSKITKMNYLLSYYGDIRFQSFNADLSCWDVSSVTDMRGMFDSASAFNNNLSSWDVSSVTIMEGMFRSASSFNNNISSWDVSSVTNMWFMFDSASAFNSVITSWDVSSVTKMTRIFKDATVFGMRLCNWNLENLVDMDELFDGSNCDFRRCLSCTYAPTSSPSFTLLSSSPSSSSSYTPTYRNITLFPTKASSSSSVPTLSPTTKKRKQKETKGKKQKETKQNKTKQLERKPNKRKGKFDYLGDKYSCKQLNKSKKRYRKRMCMRVKQARNLCPVICKYKI